MRLTIEQLSGYSLRQRRILQEYLDALLGPGRYSLALPISQQELDGIAEQVQSLLRVDGALDALGEAAVRGAARRIGLNPGRLLWFVEPPGRLSLVVYDNERPFIYYRRRCRLERLQFQSADELIELIRRMIRRICCSFERFEIWEKDVRNRTEPTPDSGGDASH
jgi:hypothetical protein